MDAADTPKTPDRDDGRKAGLLRRHRSGLVWGAVFALIVVLQWPMIKGTFYRYSKVPAPAGSIAWRSDFPAALAESRQTGKPVLLDFTASWCPPCQVLKHEVWPDTQVGQAVTAGYIPVLLDVDVPASQDVARRYGVRSVPSILVVDADGQVVRQSGYRSKGAMLEFLRSPG